MSEGKKRKIVVTGAAGFIGANICEVLARGEKYEPLRVTRSTSAASRKAYIKAADAIVHLAGVNRPEHEQEHFAGNRDFTIEICREIQSERSDKLPILFASSQQAGSESCYGQSKLAAEEVIRSYSEGGGSARIFRLPNVFGKWSRPNYNSVVATFCHNLLRNAPIRIDDETAPITLVHVDDVIASTTQNLDELFSAHLGGGAEFRTVAPQFELTVGELATRLTSLARQLQSSEIPDLSDPLTKRLQSTMLSFLPVEQASRRVELKTDNRGALFELLRSHSAGQVFVSTTRPGVTRGNHFHHSKNERFCVVSGEAIVRMRALHSEEVQTFFVSGQQPESVAILPGYTHSIENSGPKDLITIFWANEPFSSSAPDTHFEKVLS